MAKDNEGGSVLLRHKRLSVPRHPEVLGATRRASKDEQPHFRIASFEARLLRSLAPQQAI